MTIMDNTDNNSISNRSSISCNIELLESHATQESSRFQDIKKFFQDRFSGGSHKAGFVTISIASVGTGMMLLPGASTYSGLIWSIVQLIICSLISYYLNLVLIRCAVKRKVCSYQELSEQTYGRRFRWLTNITIFIANGALVVFYFKTISSLLALFMEAVASNPDNWVAGSGQKAVPLIIATIFVLPLSLPKQLKKLRYLWAINLVFILFICGVVVQQAFMYKQIKRDPNELLQINFSGFAKTFPSIIFALYHYNALDVFGDLTSSSKKIMKRVVKHNKIFIFVLYLLMITFGYLTFTNRNLQNPQYINQIILIDYISVGVDGSTQSFQTIVIVSLLLMSFVLTTKMPVFVIPAKDGIQDFFFPKKADRYGQPVDSVISPYIHFTFIAVVIYSCAAVSIFLQNIILTINVISSIWVFHCFILPAIFYLNLPKDEQKPKHTNLSKLLMFIMSGFAIYNTYINIADLL